MVKSSIYKSESGKKRVLGFYENLLQEYYQPSEQYMVETTFGRTFVIESGSKTAPAIVLLHGTGSNSAMWIADVKELSVKHRVFAIDIIGECGMSSENRPDFKSDHYANWLSEILENLELKNVSIIGCSLGAWMALDFSIKHPEKVKKLVLLATAGVTQVKASTIFWIIVTSITGKWGFDKLNRMVYGNLEIDKRVLEFTSLVKEHFKPRTEVLPVFTDDQLKQIQASTLFIGGENDCFYNSQKTATRLYGTIEKFKYFVLKNTGHVLVDQTARIVQFLNEEQNEV